MKKIVLCAFIVAGSLFYGQNMKITSEYGSKDSFTNQLMDFQNITVEKINFSAPELVGKYPLVKIKEFKNGKLTKTEILLHPETYSKIETANYYLRFFTEISEEQNTLKTFLRGERFSIRKRNFPLISKSEEYAFKDLFGNQKELTLDLSKENTLFLITTPHPQANGFSSWCEIAQSDIAPEELGTHFKIPHYFLITIQFLDKPEKL